MSQALGNFPPQEVIFESKLLPETSGTFALTCGSSADAKTEKSHGDFAEARAVIIDLRGNPGGSEAWPPAWRIAFQGKASLGSMKMRGGSMEFIAFPQPDAFNGRIVILTTTEPVDKRSVCRRNAGNRPCRRVGRNLGRCRSALGI